MIISVKYWVKPKHVVRVGNVHAQFVVNGLEHAEHAIWAPAIQPVLYEDVRRPAPSSVMFTRRQTNMQLWKIELITSDPLWMTSEEPAWKQDPAELEPIKLYVFIGSPLLSVRFASSCVQKNKNN